MRRAQLARRILEERFKIVKLEAEEIRIDFLGVNAIHGGMSPKDRPEPYEVAVRVAARTRTREEALKVGRRLLRYGRLRRFYRRRECSPYLCATNVLNLRPRDLVLDSLQYCDRFLGLPLEYP